MGWYSLVDGSVSDDTESGGRDPLPKDDVLVHQVRLDLLLEVDVEDLQLTSGCIAERSVLEHSCRILLNVPRRAMTFSSRCMMADSAEMGRRMTLLASARSMMTTCLAPFTSSRTQMYRSDSRVRVANPMLAGWIPRAVICGAFGRGASG